MEKLYLNVTPKANKSTMTNVISTNKGNKFAIPQRSMALKLYVGCPVVFIDRYARKQIEGKMTLLEELKGDIADNGWQRYNVHVKDLEEVPFTDAKFLLTGVAWY